MIRSRLSLISTVPLTLLISCGTALAQTRDHMKCYRVDDGDHGSSVIDVETLPFGLDAGCTVIAKARELCVPAEPEVMGPAADSDFAGEELDGDRLCYRVKCPKRLLPAFEVADRFGSRPVSVRRARKLCTPANSEIDAP